ncbi:MAG: hypothetical protein P1P85_00795 [Patescibacteria group bacterium]|nr:hypothetical protein [Patescibacteria group bacterium]
MSINWAVINRKTIDGNNPLDFKIRDGVNPKIMVNPEIFEKIFNDSQKLHKIIMKGNP